MELFITESHFIIQDGEYSLWCSRSNGNFQPNEGTSLCSAWNPVCVGVVYGVIGKLKLHPDSEWRLLLVRQRELVGMLAGHNIYKIKKITVLPLTTAVLANDLDLELCSKHHFGMKKPERITDTQQMSIQKTWNTIKNAAENVKSRKKETKDKEKFEKRMYEELLKMYNDSDFFYYSDTFDLTNSIQRQNQSTYDANAPLWKRADERFFWNRHLLNDLMEFQSKLADHWIVPIIQGFVQMNKCIMDFDEERHSSPGLSPEFNCTFRLEPLSYLICLISRRSRHHAGTRSRKRGIEESGACANYVETEQVIEFSPHVVSFVQVRGSIPVFWSQSGVKYRPPPRLTRDEDESHKAFLAHIGEQLRLFGQVTIVSLAEIAGKEQVVGDAYLSHVLQFNSPLITYITFDFHEYCRGMKFENVSILTDGIKDIIKKMRYCWVDTKGVICEQNGVFRVNCIDCLDRTNVVQTAIARIVMETQFRKLGLLPPEETLPPSCRRAYQQLWANNGDAISQQYAGTAALKGDFTRTGERKLAGVMKDGMNSANRYYLRFRDAYRQAAIDLTLGQPVSDDLLVKSEEPVDDGVDDVVDGDDQMEKEENLKQLIEDCKRMLVVEPEQCLGGWSVINADPVEGDPDRQEMDVILLLSQRSVYVAWYNDEEEQITQYQSIYLEDVEKIEIGAEPAVFKSRFVCLRLYYRHQADEGFFHTFRTPSTRLFNNVIVPVKNQEDAKESLRAIAQSFVAAQKIFSLDLPVIERSKLDRKKTQRHPEVVDVHQQQQENSLSSIHLPRDVSAEVRSDITSTDMHANIFPPSRDNLAAPKSPKRSPRQSPQLSRKRSPQQSPKLSPQRSPQSSSPVSLKRSSIQLSPRRAAATALGVLSQLSAHTTPRGLGFLKPNLSNIIPNRPLKRQAPVATSIGAEEVNPWSGSPDANGEFNDEENQILFDERENSVDFHVGSDDAGLVPVKTSPYSSAVQKNPMNAVSSESRDHDIDGKQILFRVRKDWQEVNLESCGIIATSPTHLLVSSFKWASVHRSFRRSLDMDGSSLQDKQEVNVLKSSGADHVTSDSMLHVRMSKLKELPTAFATTSPAKNEVVGGADDRVKVDESTILSSSCLPEIKKEDTVTVEEVAGGKYGHLYKTVSAEDVPHLVDDSLLAAEKDSYCILDEEEVKAILSKSDQLHHPHMKNSLSDTSITCQQHPPVALSEPTATGSRERTDSNPFARLRLKMSSLTVPRSSNRTVLAISKSHIKKSQRALEVFERLVREKLNGDECQSRIIFI